MPAYVDLLLLALSRDWNEHLTQICVKHVHEIQHYVKTFSALKLNPVKMYPICVHNNIRRYICMRSGL